MLLFRDTVELQWLERLWNHENMFETGVVRANVKVVRVVTFPHSEKRLDIMFASLDNKALSN